MNLIVECGNLKITGGELEFVACRLANVLIFLQMSLCRFWQLERTVRYGDSRGVGPWDDMEVLVSHVSADLASFTTGGQRGSV